MAKDRYPFPGVPVWQNPDRMSGVLRFDGTRVPISALFENLEGGLDVEEFIDSFEGVTREQVIAVLEHARKNMTQAAA
jgi:uncharacterized protein (DUF433 family)